MLSYLKKEKVLTLSLLLAAASAFIVPPDREYPGYIDVRVLALLFCLMLLVKGLQSIGLFDLLIRKLFGGLKSSRRLSQLLIFLCFFVSMLITNDVALLTFVPFTILALNLCHQERLIIRVVVLETIAANLGSMATPIGNPQNLYLFSVSGMHVGEFLLTMLPLTALSMLLLFAAAFLIPDAAVSIRMDERMGITSRKEMAVYLLLFLLNLLVVFRVLIWPAALIITAAGVLLLKRWRLFLKVDYSLLLTFVFFFVFVGNLGRIPQMSRLLRGLLEGREILVSALLSQGMSNVPASLLLSGFTDNYRGLLLGCNIGGLGTPIASMASLISYKLYAAQPEADKGKYMWTFTVYNVIGLIVLLMFGLIVYG